MTRFERRTYVKVVRCQIAPKKSRPIIRLHQRRYRRAHIRSLTFRQLGTNRAIAYLMLRRREQHGEWSCLDALWWRESKWSVTADNPTSSAYGIPQALPGSKMGSGWESNARVQIRWGLGYVNGRYGGPCGADGFQRANGWY